MAFLADTSVWSLAFRRDNPRPNAEVMALSEALAGGERVAATGLILLELLRGFVPPRAQKTIQSAFSAIELIEPTTDDHVAAAGLSNTCRKHGVQLTTIDALIAQLCIAHSFVLLTTDADFRHAAEHIPIVVWSS